MKNLYPTKQVIKVTQITENQLKYWVRTSLVEPIRKSKVCYYTFRDLIKLRMIASLKKEGLSLQKIRKGLINLSEALPASDKHLSRLVVYTNGFDMIVSEKGMHFSAITKQRYLAIDAAKIQNKVQKLESNEFQNSSTKTKHNFA